MSLTSEIKPSVFTYYALAVVLAIVNIPLLFIISGFLVRVLGFADLITIGIIQLVELMVAAYGAFRVIKQPQPTGRKKWIRYVITAIIFYIALKTLFILLSNNGLILIQ